MSHQKEVWKQKFELISCLCLGSGRDGIICKTYHEHSRNPHKSRGIWKVESSTCTICKAFIFYIISTNTTEKMSRSSHRKYSMKKVFLKIRNIHCKTPVLKSLFTSHKLSFLRIWSPLLVRNEASIIAVQWKQKCFRIDREHLLFPFWTIHDKDCLLQNTVKLRT